MLKINGTVKKAVSLVMAAVMCVGVVFCVNTSADTQSDLEAQQAQLAEERKAIEAELAELEGKAEEQEKYLAEYDEKMRIQEEEIAVVEEQIKLYEDEVAILEFSISEKESELEEGVQLFRQRLRALYMAGSSSYASVLTGASDFYDMLVRMELMERVSQHDNDLIEELNSQIAALNTDKTKHSETIEQLEKKRADKLKYYDELRETYNNHVEVKAMKEAEMADYNARYDEIKEREDEVEEQLQAEIRRKQEEAEKRRKEEEERRRQEEEKKRKEAESKGETYTEQDVSTFTSYNNTGWVWPVPTVRNISDGYGDRYIVEENRYDFHKGIDITKPGCHGEPIIASAGGEVITAGNTGNGYGYHVVIDHGNSISTLYGHCSSLNVKVGDIVNQGDVIAYIGNTGYSYGSHLHFEVRKNGQHTDPFNYVDINN
ncbi:MAG: peptidoglycan DD-metalloendopeptidase family protein [Oscillospiraceae bacterium]|nr:peptidoglycan DD-metalloendopeptidase family protein [Oscillospiraceae bacterium]